MKSILFICFIPYVFIFSQVQSLEKSTLNTCKQQETSYSKLLSMGMVKLEEINVSELNSGLNILNLRKKIIYTENSNDIFLVSKIFNFPNLTSSRYTFHENHLTIDEAKSLLVNLIKLEEEFKKADIKKEVKFYNSYLNSSTFMKVGVENSYVNVKTITGSIKLDYNGDEVLEKKITWFLDLDYSCNDNRTVFVIKDINQFIELLRNTIYN